MPIKPARTGTTKLWLCVEPNTKHLPFSQYDIAERGSIDWCELPAVTKVSSSTSLAFLNAASTSPYDHSAIGSPIGSVPSSARAKSAAFHFTVLRLGGPVNRLSRTLPSERAFGPPG